jgi:hypothetical protein
MATVATGLARAFVRRVKSRRLAERVLASLVIDYGLVTMSAPPMAFSMKRINVQRLACPQPFGNPIDSNRTGNALV